MDINEIPRTRRRGLSEACGARFNPVPIADLSAPAVRINLSICIIGPTSANDQSFALRCVHIESFRVKIESVNNPGTRKGYHYISPGG